MKNYDPYKATLMYLTTPLQSAPSELIGRNAKEDCVNSCSSFRAYDQTLNNRKRNTDRAIRNNMARVMEQERKE